MVEFWDWPMWIKITIAIIGIAITTIAFAKLSDLGDEDFEI